MIGKLVKLDKFPINYKRLTSINVVYFNTSNQNNQSTNNSQKSNTIYYYHIKNIQEKKIPITIYQSKYNFSNEKSLIASAYIFGIVSGSVLFISNLGLFFKIPNFLFFCPCLFIIMDNLLKWNVFIKQIKLISPTEVELIDMSKRITKCNVSDIMKAIDDPNKKNVESLNHVLFYIIKIKNKRGYYNLPRDCTLLDETLFEDIITGNKLI